MDFPTLAQAKKYTRKNRLGGAETQRITWDGDMTGKTIIADTGSMYVVKVSDNPISVAQKTLKKVSMAGIVLGEFIEEEQDMSTFVVDSFQTGVTVIAKGTAESNEMYVLIYEQDVLQGETTIEKGVYFRLDRGEIDYFVSLIETETIHQIDPKFIPGVVLPLVEIAENLDRNATMESPQQLSEETNAKLTAVFDNGMPCVIKAPSDGATLSTTADLASYDVMKMIQFRAEATDYILADLAGNGQWVFLQYTV